MNSGGLISRIDEILSEIRPPLFIDGLPRNLFINELPRNLFINELPRNLFIDGLPRN